MIFDLHRLLCSVGDLFVKSIKHYKTHRMRCHRRVREREGSGEVGRDLAKTRDLIQQLVRSIMLTMCGH